MQIRSIAEADEDTVIRLWERCDLTRPWNDPHKDIARKLAVRPDLFLIAVDGGEIVGSVMVGYDGHRGWINYLAVAPASCRQGLGRALMAEAERRLLREGCPKVNLQVRAETRGRHFYRKLGYAVEEMVNMGKRLIEDRSEAG